MCTFDKLRKSSNSAQHAQDRMSGLANPSFTHNDKDSSTSKLCSSFMTFFTQTSKLNFSKSFGNKYFSNTLKTLLMFSASKIILTLENFFKLLTIFRRNIKNLKYHL